MLPQGKVRACEALKNDPEMMAEIEEQVRQALLNLKAGGDQPLPTTVVAVEDEPAEKAAEKVEVGE